MRSALQWKCGIDLKALRQTESPTFGGKQEERVGCFKIVSGNEHVKKLINKNEEK